MDVAARYLAQLREWVGWRVSTDADFSGYWDPRARGVDRATRRGSYFTGRRRARQELIAWAGDPGRSGIRVITGGPGSGKSALIAHLLTLSDPWVRSQLPGTQRGLMAGEAASAAAGWASVGVRATGLDRAGVAAKLAAGLSIPAGDPDRLLAALAERDHRSRLTVVVDGLDEAVTPMEADRIARTLLAPLAADANIAVLAGTRRGRDNRLVRAFGPRAVVIDLDDPAYFEFDDLVSYAAASLRLDHDPASASPYRDDPATEAVARAIASAANPSFLVAGLAARARAEDLEVIDTTTPGRQTGQGFPADVDAAMAEYLQHVPNWELLVPVAYARPPGVPRDTLWPALAAAYAGRPVGAAEIDALLQSAAAYLIETTVGGNLPTVSLFHQALIDHVRNQARGPAIETAFTDVLSSRVGQAGGWPHADDYTRRHLATHAAAAGRLDALMADPGFLLAAEPKPLMSALGSLVTMDARLAASAYRVARPRLERTSAGGRRSYLELAARRVGATALADRTHALAGAAAWQPIWATRRRARRILTRHQNFAFTVAVGDVDGETVAVSGGPDGIVRAIELATSTALGAVVTDDGVAVMAQPGNPVGAVAVGQFRGAAHAIASFSNGLVCARDLRTGSEATDIIAAHERPGPGPDHWTMLAAAEHHPLLATGEMDEVIRIWNLEAGQLSAELHHPGGVLRLATGEIDGSPVLVSGGFDGTVRLWDFATGRQQGKTYRAGEGQVRGLGTIALDGHLVVLASVLVKSTPDAEYGRPGVIQAWDIQTGRSVPHLTRGRLAPGALGAAMIRGQPIIALASHWTLSIIDGRSGARLVPDFYTDKPTIVLSPADVDGNLGVVAGQDWGAVELILADEVAGSAGSSSSDLGSITSARVAERGHVVVGGIDRERVRLWDLSRDSTPSVPDVVHERTISSFDVATAAGGRIVAVAGSRNPQRILAWDVDTGQPLADLEATGSTEQITVAHAEGRTIIVGIGDSIRLWDLATGPLWHAQLPELTNFWLRPRRPLVYSNDLLSAVLWWTGSASRAWDLFTGKPLAATPHQQGLTAAAVATAGQEAVGMLGTESGSILAWELRTGKRLSVPFKCSGMVSALAIGEQAGETTILAAASGVWEWNLADGHLIDAVEDQGESVSVVTVIRLGNERALCTGSMSGRVRIPAWNLALELDEEIDDIFGISEDRFVVATMSGIVAVKVHEHG